MMQIDRIVDTALPTKRSPEKSTAREEKRVRVQRSFMGPGFCHPCGVLRRDR